MIKKSSIFCSRGNLALYTSHLPYRSPKGLAKTVKILLVILSVLALLSILGCFIEIAYYSSLDSTYPSDEDYLIGGGVSGIVGIFIFLTYIGTVISFSMWIFRIYKNLPVLTTAKMRMSPGWAVGWYFIPFANLFMPYIGMKDAWNACSRDTRFDNYLWGERKGASLVKWWWAMWLISTFIARVAGRISMSAETTDELVRAAVVYIFSDILDLVTNILAFMLVKRLTERQEKKWEAVQASGLHSGQAFTQAATNREADFSYKEPTHSTHFQSNTYSQPTNSSGHQTGSSLKPTIANGDQSSSHSNTKSNPSPDSFKWD